MSERQGYLLIKYLVVGLLLMILEVQATGKDTTTNITLTRIVNRAAKADPDALLELARRFEYGLGVKTNLERAHQIYCQAARLGVIRAQLVLARMYLAGTSITRNQEQARAWLVQATRSGDPVAQVVLRAIPSSPLVAANCDSGPPVCGLRPLPSGNLQDRTAIQAWVQVLAPEYGLDPNLVLTIIAMESNFNPQARSSKNARGVMQLIPETAARFGVADIADPVENLKGGMAYLRWLMAYFQGNIPLVAAAYNAGEGAVEKYAGIPPYHETKIYVERVNRRYPQLFHPYYPQVTKPSSLIGSKIKIATFDYLNFNMRNAYSEKTINN